MGRYRKKNTKFFRTFLLITTIWLVSWSP